MSRVWEHSLQKGSSLLLLVAIADFADDKGVAWPSVATLAKKVRLGERYVQQLIKELVQAKELCVEDQAHRYTTNRYTVLVGGVNSASPLNPASPRGVNPSSPGGEPRLTRGVNPASPNPSFNHQEPPESAQAPKPTDPLFAAIAEVCQVDPELASQAVGKVRYALGRSKPPYTSEEVRKFGILWWEYKDRQTAPTLRQLQEHVGRVRAKSAKPEAQKSKIRYVNND